MGNAIASGLKETFGIRLLFCVAFLPFIIILSQMQKMLQTFPVTALLPASFHVDYISDAITSNLVVSFVPVVAVLPFAGGYIDELKSKFCRFICIRSSYKKYILSRIVVCYLSGALVVLLGVLTAWGIAAVVFIPMEEVKSSVNNSVNVLVEKCLLLFLEGGLWAVVGMSMSTIMESKYISYATPFVFYYLLVILYERYFTDLFIIYPKTWTDPAAWPFGCWGAAIFLLEMTLIFAILFVLRAGRRLQQL